MSDVVQVQLRSGATRRTCWLSQSRKFKIRDRVTLKNSEDADRLWTVLSISDPKGADEVHTDWRVGGL